MLLEEIRTRKSVRTYSEQPLSEEVIDEILEAGRLAPSWVNVQPWKFIVIKDPVTKELLYKASGGQKQVLNANVVIACVADFEAWEKKNFGKVLEQNERHRDAKDFILSSPSLNPSLLGDTETLVRTVEQLTYAIAYMTLQAEKSGVGMCVLGAIANEMTHGDKELVKEVRERLKLNDKHLLLTLLTLGYEKTPTETKKLRKEKDEVVFRESL